MTQTTEQKILMLVGISVVWIIVLLIIFREIGWYACIAFSVVYAGMIFVLIKVMLLVMKIWKRTFCS